MPPHPSQAGTLKASKVHVRELGIAVWARNASSVANSGFLVDSSALHLLARIAALAARATHVSTRPCRSMTLPAAGRLVQAIDVLRHELLLIRPSDPGIASARCASVRLRGAASGGSRRDCAPSTVGARSSRATKVLQHPPAAPRFQRRRRRDNPGCPSPCYSRRRSARTAWRDGR